MRSLTKWLFWALFFGIFATQATPVAAEIPIGVGGSIGQPFKETISGIVDASVDILSVASIDANNIATEWNGNVPEASWTSRSQQLLQITNRDCCYFYIKDPPVLKNVRDVGITLVTDEKLMNPSNTFSGKFVPAKGWQVLIKPGQLPLGMDDLYCYVKHGDNMSGFNVLFFVIKWHTDGEMWTTLQVLVRQAPPNFDRMSWLLRNKFRSGTIDAGYESIVANLPEAERKAYDKIQQQFEDEKAAREAASRQQQLLQDGQYCPQCYASRGEILNHPVEMCPSLYHGAKSSLAPPPTAPATPTGNSQASTQLGVAAASRPTAKQTSAPAPRPAQSQSQWGGMNPSMMAQTSSQPTVQFFYHGRPVTGTITIPFNHRENPGLVLRLVGAVKVTLLYRRGENGGSASSIQTQPEFPFNFSNFERDTYYIKATPESASGVKSAPVRLRIIIR